MWNNGKMVFVQDYFQHNSFSCERWCILRWCNCMFDEMLSNAMKKQISSKNKQDSPAPASDVLSSFWRRWLTEMFTWNFHKQGLFHWTIFDVSDVCSSLSCSSVRSYTNLKRTFLCNTANVSINNSTTANIEAITFMNFSIGLCDIALLCGDNHCTKPREYFL